MTTDDRATAGSSASGAARGSFAGTLFLAFVGGKVLLEHPEDGIALDETFHRIVGVLDEGRGRRIRGRGNREHAHAIRGAPRSAAFYDDFRLIVENTTLAPAERRCSATMPAPTWNSAVP